MDVHPTKWIKVWRVNHHGWWCSSNIHGGVFHIEGCFVLHLVAERGNQASSRNKAWLIWSSTNPNMEDLPRRYGHFTRSSSYLIFNRKACNFEIYQPWVVAVNTWPRWDAEHVEATVQWIWSSRSCGTKRMSSSYKSLKCMHLSVKCISGNASI